MQRSADHQKTLAAHGALISDERLPLAILDFRELTTLEGRILVHGKAIFGRSPGAGDRGVRRCRVNLAQQAPPSRDRATPNLAWRERSR
jgi:hypothetical protein